MIEKDFQHFAYCKGVATNWGARGGGKGLAGSNWDIFCIVSTKAI